MHAGERSRIVPSRMIPGNRRTDAFKAPQLQNALRKDPLISKTSREMPSPSCVHLLLSWILLISRGSVLHCLPSASTIYSHHPSTSCSHSCSKGFRASSLVWWQQCPRPPKNTCLFAHNVQRPRWAIVILDSWCVITTFTGFLRALHADFLRRLHPQR